MAAVQQRRQSKWFLGSYKTLQMGQAQEQGMHNWVVHHLNVINAGGVEMAPWSLENSHAPCCTKMVAGLQLSMHNGKTGMVELNAGNVSIWHGGFLCPASAQSIGWSQNLCLWASCVLQTASFYTWVKLELQPSSNMHVTEKKIETVPIFASNITFVAWLVSFCWDWTRTWKQFCEAKATCGINSQGTNLLCWFPHDRCWDGLFCMFMESRIVSTWFTGVYNITVTLLWELIRPTLSWSCSSICKVVCGAGFCCKWGLQWCCYWWHLHNCLQLG